MLGIGESGFAGPHRHRPHPSEAPLEQDRHLLRHRVRHHPADRQTYRQGPAPAPTYGDGGLPGQPNGTKESSWAEFLPRLAGQDLSGIRVALYGLGDQQTYPKHFLDAMSDLHACLAGLGAEMLGSWPVEGYAFERSRAVRDGRFLGLALDQHLQHLLTDQRIEAWLDDLAPRLLPGLKVAAADPALSASHP